MANISHDHSDRDEVKRRAEADFVSIYLEHGGTQRWKKLICLFHEDHSPSATIYKGRFHCFGCGVNLDVFEFVMRGQHTDFKGALAFLATRYNVTLTSGDLTEQEKRDYARRRAQAEAEAEQLVEWKRIMIAALRAARDEYQHGYHRAVQYIIRNGLDAPAGNLAADVADLYEARYLDLDQKIGTVDNATYRDLLRIFRVFHQRRAA